METISLNGEDGSGAGCVATATTPDSPSSGYWSTNDDDLSDDVFSASLGLGFDPSDGYGGSWLLSPYRGPGNEFDDDESGLKFGTDSWKSDGGFEPDVGGFQPEAEVDLGPEIALELELTLEQKASADLNTELIEEAEPGSIPEVETELESEMSLATGSSLLADFLFCDWIHGSRPADRMFSELISGDVFPPDAFDGVGLAIGDREERWKESSAGSPREPHRRSRTDDESQNFSADAVTFELDPVHPFDTFPSTNRSTSPFFPIDRISLDCYEPPEIDQTYSSGCASPTEVASGCATPNSDFRSSCLDSEELFDVLLCEVLRKEPEANAATEVAKAELFLVATPSASKRKLRDDDKSPRPKKSARLRSRTCSEGSRVIELPVTSSNVLPMTSASDRPFRDESRNFGDSSQRGKTQDNRESRTSGEFKPVLEIFHVRPDFTETGIEPVRNSECPMENSDRACAKGTAGNACAEENAGDACAVGRAEVLAAMLQAEVVLREPNRGSDVIFAELRNGRVGGESGSPPSVVPSTARPSQRGASSLRSFLIRKQRDSSTARQNLLHRLLKGETSEAEVRREQAESLQTTRDSAVDDES